jgi:hypothetical protein
MAMAVSRRTVTPAGDQGWTIDGQGSYRTQEEAIADARQQLLSTGGGELVIKGTDGRIRQQDTVGRPDPTASRG